MYDSGKGMWEGGKEEKKKKVVTGLTPLNIFRLVDTHADAVEIPVSAAAPLHHHQNRNHLGRDIGFVFARFRGAKAGWMQSKA